MFPNSGRAGAVSLSLSLLLVAILLSTSLSVPASPAHASRAPVASAAYAVRAPVATIAKSSFDPSPASAPPAPNWYNLTAGMTNYPSARTFTQFAWDPALGADVLFGGYDESVFADGDTWLFMHGNWSDITPNLTVAPNGRWGGALLWDPALHGMILFGGRDLSVEYNDTWLFNASGWTNLHLTVHPSPRQGMRVDYDPHLGGIYLYGGGCKLCSSGGYINYDDSWEFVGGSWTNITTSVVGAPTVMNELTYDALDGYTLGFGASTTCTGSNATFAFNGSTLTWTTLVASGAPNFPAADGMVYDASLRAVVLFGGNDPVNGGTDCVGYPSTWTYASGAWRNLTSTLSTSPGDRYASIMTYDGSEGVVLAEGGSRYQPRPYGYYSPDLWCFPYPPFWTNGTTWTRVHEPPLTVTESATFHGGSGGPVLFSWDWGDGSPNGTTASANHTYTRAGNFTMVLTAIDSGGQSVNWTQPVEVLPSVGALLRAVPMVGIVPFSTTLSASGFGGTGGPYSYHWYFADGTPPMTGGSVSHTFTIVGSFNVTVETTDSTGELGNSSVVVKVVNPLTLIAATVNVTTGPAPLSVAFTANFSGGAGPILSLWSFGDGGQMAAANTSHTYTTSGTYTAMFTGVDTLGEHVAQSFVITPYRPISVSLVAAPTSLQVGFPVNFTATATGGNGGDQYAWTGLPKNCTSANSAYLVCTPGAAGSFNVSVRVTDAAQETSTSWAKFTVTPIPTSPSNPSGNGNPSGLPWWLFAVIGAVAAAAVVAAILLFRRRASPPSG